MPRRQNEYKALLSGPGDNPVVYLLDVATDLEERLLTKWISRQVQLDIDAIRIPSSKRGKGGDPDSLTKLLRGEEETYIVPARVVWMAPKRGSGRRSVGWTDAFKPGDPRDPRGLRAYWIRTFRPSRVKLIAAAGASSFQLAADYESSDEVDGVGPYVTRRAWRVLDQAERKLRGNRYKIPRFVPQTILSRRQFIETIEAVAEKGDMDRDKALDKAEDYLHEIAATHSPYVIDMIAGAIHSLYRQGYGEITYEPEQVAEIAALGNSNPVVFLPSHRSNLDRLSLQFMLWENDLPPNHTAGGINMNFFPVGPLMRRTGVFFIRRSFRDNELYKAVLQAYIDFLVEKRFPLEWYLEGGRSRSGKLRPPRFGMLNYVVDSQRRGKADDIKLIPVSIAYDQIQDVPDYAREAQGRGKEDESIGWLFRAIQSLRRRYGDIHIRFGEPVSVADVIGEIEPGEEASLGLQKLAFEVMHRIGDVTPITPAAVVSIALLAARGSAKTASELAVVCETLWSFIEARELPTTDDPDLSDPEAVVAILDWLAEHGNVSSHEAVGRTVYWLDDDQMIRVSYYRNVVVHFFLNRAIAEMALTSMISNGSRSADEMRRRSLDLRDLLKFEFFFPGKEEFLSDLYRDVAIDVPDWETTLGSSGALGVLAKMGTSVAYWAVLPILDGYQIVGDELESLDRAFDEKSFLKACLARARMYRIEDRLLAGESASQVLFKSALQLAKNRDLLEEGEDVGERRLRFAEEIREARELASLGLDG